MTQPIKSVEDFDVYRRRDYRMKCTGCRRWMRHRPTLGSDQVMRRAVPHAGHCVDCDPHKEYPSSRASCRVCFAPPTHHEGEP